MQLKRGMKKKPVEAIEGTFFQRNRPAQNKSRIRKDQPLNAMQSFARLLLSYLNSIKLHQPASVRNTFKPL
jgi:hypothetical protein